MGNEQRRIFVQFNQKQLRNTLLLLLGALLPLQAMVWVMICVTAALGIAPIAYSYAIFRQHRKAGVAYEKIPKSRAEKIASRVAAVLVCVTRLGPALLRFAGKGIERLQPVEHGGKLRRYGADNSRDLVGGAEPLVFRNRYDRISQQSGYRRADERLRLGEVFPGYVLQ